MTSRFHRIALLGAALLSAGIASPLAAQDRDEFYAIARGETGRRAAPESRGGGGFGFFSLFGGGNRGHVPEITVRPGEGERGLRSQSEQGRSASGENLGGPRAYCVRTCDGFFFPMGPATSGGARQAQQESCNAMCPGAEVALYSVSRQGSIEDAVNARGQTYSALRTAFRFRQGLERTCSCQGAAANGLARLPITHDVTLRPGDVVVTETGAQVFRGASRFPYQPRDFVAARSYGRLPADVRRRVDEIQAGIQAGDTGISAPVARLSRPARIAGGGSRDVAAPTPVSIPVNEGRPSVRVIDMTLRRDTLVR